MVVTANDLITVHVDNIGDIFKFENMPISQQKKAYICASPFYSRLYSRRNSDNSIFTCRINLAETFTNNLSNVLIESPISMYALSLFQSRRSKASHVIESDFLRIVKNNINEWTLLNTVTLGSKEDKKTK